MSLEKLVIASQCSHCVPLRTTLRAVARLQGTCGCLWRGNPPTIPPCFFAAAFIRPGDSHTSLMTGVDWHGGF